MSEIDLGVSGKERYGSLPCCPPEDNPTHYPSFHYSGPEELELPEEGEMLVRFCKTSETSRVRDDGSHWYECEIKVEKILKVNSSDPVAPTRRDTSAEDALDALAKKLAERKEKDDE